MGVARAKKFDIGFATELWVFEIEKSKHIFIKISKTTDLNFTIFCALAFPELLFPIMNIMMNIF